MGLAAGTRRTVWTGALCAVTALVAHTVLALWVLAPAGPPALDRATLSWFVAHRVGWATGLSRVLALVGGPGAMTVLAAVGVVALLRWGERAGAVVVAATGAVAVLLTHGFKALYARSRPPETDQVIVYTNHALPSGHALGSIVVVGMLCAVLVPRLGAGARTGLVVGTAVFVAAVGASRVYLGAHWLTDVLVAWLLGAAVLAAGVTALRVRATATDRPQPTTGRTSHTTSPPRS